MNFSKLYLLGFLLLFAGPKLLAQNFKTVSDLEYYNGADATSKHQLDLYLPNAIEDAPMLLWIHGGAWAFGDRKREQELAEKFVKEGIAVAVVSYRLSPGTWADPKFDKGIQHPEHIRDIARAFAWIYKNAREYGYSSQKVFVSGYSAGGHLAALLAGDDRYLKAESLSTKLIAGIIPIAGAYDISDYHQAHYRDNPDMAEKHVKAVFGSTEADFKHASPTTYVENINCPVFLISENQSYDYTLLFENALKAAKVENASFLHVRELDHRGLYFNLAGSENSKYRQQIVDFINKWSSKEHFKGLKR